MGDELISISKAFKTFLEHAPRQSAAWMDAVRALEEASALDKKTAALTYLAVLAVLRLESGIPFHVSRAKQAGASRDEVISALLIGLPAAGNCVTQVLPAAIDAFDSA